MGRHEENTVVSGIMNYGGTNTFKNTVVDGRAVNDNDLNTPNKDRTDNTNTKDKKK